MNKLTKILVSMLGATNVLMDVLTPILLVFLWIKFSGLTDFGSYLFYAIGLFASLFRGIRFWIK